MEILNIFYILLLISASALCVALIIYLSNITKSVKEISIDIKDLSSQMKPLITSTAALSEKLNSLTDEAKGQFSILKGIVSEIKERSDAIFDLEEKIRGGIEGHALDLIKNLSSVANGASAFWSAYRKK
jgi:uncharacterized protein YoxC